MMTPRPPSSSMGSCFAIWVATRRSTLKVPNQVDINDFFEQVQRKCLALADSLASIADTGKIITDMDRAKGK